MREDPVRVPLIPMLTVASGDLDLDPGLFAGTWNAIYLLDMYAARRATPSFDLIEELSGVFHVIYDFCPRTVDDVVDAFIKGADEVVIDPGYMERDEMDEVMDLAEGVVYKYTGMLPPRAVRSVLWEGVRGEHERFFKDIPVYVRRGIRTSGIVLGVIAPAGEVLHDRGTQKGGQIRINDHRFV